MARASLRAHVQMSFLDPVKLHFGNKLAYELRSSSRRVLNGGKRSNSPNLVRVLKASHVMYVGCDVGGRNSDHKCGVLLTSRRRGIYLIIFSHLAFGPSKCRDERVVNEDIQDQVAGDEMSTRIGILLGVSMKTRGNAYAKLLFDAAEARKRWLGNWSVMVEGVTDGPA